MSDNAFSVPVFGSATQAPAPASGIGGNAVASTQAGVVAAGSDYGANAKVQLAKVDALGSQYVVPMGAAGLPGSYQGGVAISSTGATSGPVPMALYGLVPTPLQVDSNAALQVVMTPKATFRTIATAITCSTNAILLTLTNGSSSMVRIATATINVPGAGSAANLLGLGSGATYYPLYCELWRLTAAPSGGSSQTCVPSDSAVTLASGITSQKAATSGTKSVVLHRKDAIPPSSASIPWYRCECTTEQNVLVRPGESIAVVCVSNGTITSSTGSTATALVDVQLVFSQAAT